MPAGGDRRGHLDALVAEGCHNDRDLVANRRRDHLERLAESRSAFPKRHLVLAPVVVQALTLPDVATDFDRLAKARCGRIVGDAVPAFDDLRARSLTPNGHSRACRRPRPSWRGEWGYA
jgi:hypothetical protein